MKPSNDSNQTSAPSTSLRPPNDRSPATNSETNTTESAIEVHQLTDGYERNPVLCGIDLTVAAGDFFALLGRNGAGKSTLVQSLLGFRRPRQGELAVLGRDPWGDRRALMRDVALVPETPNVPPQMTSASAARFVATFLPRGRFDHETFQHLLTEDEILPRTRFGRLSRGQKSSVGLALALASRPRLLILDDPTLGLDAVARRRAYRRLIDHQAEHGSTVFLTTHDLAAVDGLATHVGFLHQGRLPVLGAVDELKQRFRLAAVAVGDETDHLPGRVVRLDHGPLGGRALVELEAGDAPSTEHELTAPTIEDLFVALLEEHTNDGVINQAGTGQAA